MASYKVVEEIEVEDILVDTIIIKRKVKDLKEAKKIADDDSEDYYNNPYRCRERHDGLDEYHRWKVYDEETKKEMYETF